jgi:hypothetical protein
LRFAGGAARNPDLCGVVEVVVVVVVVVAVVVVMMV